MATEEISDQYFIYENRLASFQGPQPVAKRRGSNAHSRAPKSLQWPHKNLAAADLAKAGFYFHPLPSNPDNVVCFLCQKALDGWEEDDNPLAEHLTHSPECGWAITAAIEVEHGVYAKEDPREPLMVEARKATFAGRWPYEGKRGWKCQTKQLVEAGWKYTPTMDSDDNTTCTYCQLALDGWEAGDKPMDEHYKRSPNCPFFSLINSQPAPKKAGRSKAARSSKASRLSIQSVATAMSDVASVTDLPADVDDSILTTTSTMTQGGKKAKGRKPAAKGRKTRAKKDEAVEIHEDDHVEEAEKPQPQAKAGRGRKRTSDEVDQSVLTNADAPAPKRRNTKARSSNAVDNSVLTIDTQHDAEMVDAPAPAKKTAGRKKAPAAKGRSRKASAASIASTASTASLRSKVPDDDELDRQLQADLERPLTDDEDILADSDSERRNAQLASKMKGKKVTTTKTAKQGQTESTDFAMFDPAPAEPNDAEVDAELKMLEAEMAVEEEEVETLKVPKKGRKAGTRKASKQTKKAKAVPPRSEPDELEEPAPAPRPIRKSNDVEAHDASTASTDTIVKKKRGRPSKKSTGSQATETEQVPQQSQPSAPETAPKPMSVNIEVESATIRESFSAMKGTPGKIERKPVASPSPVRPEKVLPALPASQSQLLQPPATPRAHHISPAHSAKQATVSPSPSPQASDAENQPPSSKPTTSANSKRVALAPMHVAATPVRNGSPSKRQNVIGGLQSTTPWTAVDLDLIFEDKENVDGATTERFFSKGGDLTSPEKRMTVEEWIYHNAGQAEQKLKHECEAMVTAFEKEGTRAMQALEGLVVD